MFRYEVEVLSEDAYIELKELEGVHIGVTILQSDGKRREINGVAMEVHSEGSDGSLALYRIILEPVLAALRQSWTSRVFLGKSDLEIVLLLLQEELENNPVFAATLNIDNRCKRKYPSREFVFLANETKWDFIRRRLAKVGISFFVGPTKTEKKDHPQHTLVLFDTIDDLVPEKAEKMLFHRASATDGCDSIHKWYAKRTL